MAATYADIAILQLPTLAALGLIYYRQGKLDEKVRNIEKLIVTRARFKR